MAIDKIQIKQDFINRLKKLDHNLMLAKLAADDLQELIDIISSVTLNEILEDESVSSMMESVDENISVIMSLGFGDDDWHYEKQLNKQK